MSDRFFASRIDFGLLMLGFRVPPAGKIQQYKEYAAIIELIIREKVNLMFDVGAFEEVTMNRLMFQKVMTSCCITIGDHARVGTNVVVISDILAYATAAGMPARSRSATDRRETSKVDPTQQ